MNSTNLKNESKIEAELSSLTPKCIICNENFDEKERKPLVLTSCGHSFCKICISNFLSKKCAICRVSFERTVENWLALEIVTLAKVSNSIKPFIDKFNFINDENKNQTLTRFETIRQQINSQTDLTIKLVKKSQSYLMDELEYEETQFLQRYSEIKKDLEQSLKLFDESLNSNLNFNYDEKLEKIKNELTRLETKHGLFTINNLVDKQYKFEANANCVIDDSFLGTLKILKEESNKTKAKTKSAQSKTTVLLVYFFLIYIFLTLFLFLIY